MKHSEISSTTLRAFVSGILFFCISCTRVESAPLTSFQDEEHSDELLDDLESEFGLGEIIGFACRRATSTQISPVNLGYTKRESFLYRCYSETGSTQWCDQIARPNPESLSIFQCTYSVNQPHVFVHPDERTWAYAIAAVKIVKELANEGIQIAMIYNWWRPEPYNANVGGAAGRHPFGTSVDVRFANKTEQNRAHSRLCSMRRQGRLRALGYYSGTGLHLGIGDQTANTWGRSCP